MIHTHPSKFANQNMSKQQANAVNPSPGYYSKNQRRRNASRQNKTQIDEIAINQNTYSSQTKDKAIKLAHQRI